MINRLLVINAVGLTRNLLGPHTPELNALAKHVRDLVPPLPAVTTTAQTTLLTGKAPQEHGAVANGWYFRDTAKVMLWQQSNSLVQGDKLWDRIKRLKPGFRTAKMFWWYNMYSTAEFSVTPRPLYRSDGRKMPGSYAFPASLNDELEAKLGKFPLFKFWGPLTDITSTRWIADATIHVMDKHQPELVLTYLPHLDYNLQRLGPKQTFNGPKAPGIEFDVMELDAEIGKLRACAARHGYEVMVLSEYGIQEVSRPVHINRYLREKGLLKVRIECGEDWFDAGASDAFAVADHQLAHVYVKDPSRVAALAEELAKLPGVARAVHGDDRARLGLKHERSGEIILLSDRDAWFTYYFWLDDAKAPDYARTVDIHQKPGYDPVELFMVPGGKAKAGWTLLKRKLGFRALLDVIPLDATLVKGSHGVPTVDPADGPCLLSTVPLGDPYPLRMQDWAGMVEKMMTE
ncbi:MAG: hypothetical protein RL095_1406 [Verrucomicrobiota bacterium]|jgi:predicted AlkP superfamily pyrophosphatase or phosphodiesterase